MLQVTEEYMAQMDSAMNDKELMLDYITGSTIMDIGCGSGRLLYRLQKSKPSLNLIGLDRDISTVSGRLARDSMHPMRGTYEPKPIQLIKGLAQDLGKYVSSGEVDTFIFSSVLHEVYSYSNFNIAAVGITIRSAIERLPIGGRIIIRDGIRPATNEKRLIHFTDPSDINALWDFQRDFKGYDAFTFSQRDKGIAEISERDAMEFLYTYTWGKDHYKREVQEQYGLFTAKEYIDFLKECAYLAHCSIRIVTYNHYLQEGYNYHLSKRVKYTDLQGNVEKLPDSNALFVIEKRRGAK